ncbi:hypothetical protein ACFC1R_19125 [Kitasatospora sp. NPDC056138]|uniref:hypothetical protein n=1 Tax=Kitasatospora sp. NPDC056138 TaxID=3345724 RepID=UPI0035DF0B74
MRIVHSTHGASDVPEELSEQIRHLVQESDDWERETLELDHRIGKYSVFNVELHALAEPGTGRPRWAVTRWSQPAPPASFYGIRLRRQKPASLLVEDTADRAEAHARYEEHVRARAAEQTAAHGDGFAFQHTDVPGLPGYVDRGDEDF